MVLDSAELVRDVHDRDSELSVERRQQLGERLLGLGVHARGRLVEHEQRRLAGQRLRDERALLHSAGERAQRRVGDGREVDSVDRLGDAHSVLALETAEQATGSQPAGGDDFSHGRRRIASDMSSLWEISERAPPGEVMCVLAVEQRRALARPLQPEDEAHERGLPTSVRPGDRDELSFAERQAHVLEHALSRPIAERHAGELDR